ncbi:phosphate-binding protein [Bacteroidales bacterium]|nr:phosphate-binding protein [Bacteroidales bacterium]
MRKFGGILILALLACACTQNAKEGDVSSVAISGAGATFPLPYYNIIFKNFTKEMGNKLTYGGIGSGGGIRSLKDKTVDFGATDAFLSEQEMKEMSAAILHIPTCMGAVVLAYNLTDLPTLNLNGSVISGIFLGDIKVWNDPQIAALNPSLSLPNKTITPVYRSDGSGTTHVFSDYLSKVSPRWAEIMGVGKSLKWPVGIAAKGNPGVAGTVLQTEGAIGYVGSEYALSLKIANAKVENASGNYIEANTESISAAADIDLPSDMRTSISNSSNEKAYPISCFTWILIYKDQYYNGRTKAQAQALTNLMDYILSEDAQSLASKVHYSPLSIQALQNAKDLLKQVSYNELPITSNLQ